MTALADILVVVPTLNEERHIVDCLESVLRHDPTMSVIVADGGSIDRTCELVLGLATRFPNVQVMHNPGRLQSAGVNKAVADHAKPTHRILVRCDAHADYPPGFVKAVAAALDAQSVASVVVPMDAVGQSGFGRAAAWIVDTPFGSGGSAHRGSRFSGKVDHGHHAGMDINWFRNLGGYDPSFSHNEDAEYDYRLRKAGGSIWIQSDLRLNYIMRTTLSGLSRQYWNYGRGRARTVLKHGMRPRLRQLIPTLNLMLIAIALCLGLIWPLAWLWPGTYLLALVLISIAGAYAIGRDGIWAGPALFSIHNFWAAGFLRQVARGRG